MATVQNPAGFPREREKEAIFFQVYNWVLYGYYIARLPGSRKCIVCLVREKSGWITAGGGVGFHFQSNLQLVIELSPAVNGQCSVGS